jgi:pimeloyl-ACP methyl ester carboxylesterase/class 3 adenylate cyclase
MAAVRRREQLMEAPEVRYARSGDVSIAYGVVGEGPFDLVFISGSVLSSLDYAWDGPPAAFFRLLASFSRLILFDKRGTGLSDRDVGMPDQETRMDDIRAVMDAVGSERAAVLGVSEGGPVTLLFAASYPERAAAAILFGSKASYTHATDDARAQSVAAIQARGRRWGTDAYADEFLELAAPSLAHDADVKRWWRRYLRSCASPSEVVALSLSNLGLDTRSILPSIRVPTLVLHRERERIFSVEDARYLAEHVPGAEYVELPGEDHAWFVDPEQSASEVERFLTGIWDRGEWDEVESDRVLATVLFTDIVGSTARAAEIGDARWREVLEDHHARVRRQLVRFRGRELDTAGDGFFASFDGPARAIRCASAITESVRELGLEVRAGLHTGECEVVDGKVAGIAVSIGARVAAQAQPGEVLVSGTVRDLVAGSGIAFDDRGAAELKGVPGEWRLFAVV